MDYDDITTFLAVVKHENIAKAASQLYISQGTASSRIQHLENELGIRLFFRQKGIKTVTLTPEGEYFLTIAQQWISLWHQAHQIKDIHKFRELRVTAIDSFNRFLFPDIYREFSSKYPNIRLYLQTEHSTKIHQMIENQKTDIGFAYTLHKSPNVTAIPLFEEELVFLCHKNSLFTETRQISDLDMQREIYLTFSGEYELWHKQKFKNSSDKRISIGTASMIPSFIGEPDAWTIVNHNVADIMVKRNPELTIIPITKNAPPKRKAYILFYKHPRPWIHEIRELLLKDIVEMVKSNPSLTLLYSGED